MSYAHRKELSGNRTLSVILTVIVVGGLMYAIVTGLAYNVVKKAAEDLKTFNVEEQPPPPEPPPPPPKDMPKVPPPPTTPPPLVQMAAPPPPIAVVVAPPPQIPAPPPPIQPPPAPKRVSQPQSVRGDLRTLITGDDYPAAAEAAGIEGTNAARLTIGPDGRVSSCAITRPSGNSALDSTLCALLKRRAKFSPARDSTGAAITATLDTPPFRWVIPQ